MIFVFNIFDNVLETWQRFLINYSEEKRVFFFFLKWVLYEKTLKKVGWKNEKKKKKGWKVCWGRIEWRRTAHMSFMSAILLGFSSNKHPPSPNFPFTHSLSLSYPTPTHTYTYPKLKKLWIWRPFLFLTFQPFPFSSSLLSNFYHFYYKYK